jgi:hypothetical protein
MWIVLALSLFLAAEQPETVLVTLHAKPGAEQALADVLARHYDIARRLDLIVPDAPHVTLRGNEEHGLTYFIEIFTWRDSDAPDHAPAAILETWKQMNALVEPRGGKPGLSFTEMTPVTRAK